MKRIKHVLFALTASSIALTVHAHEFTITLGGISSTLNSEQNFVTSGQSADEGAHSAGTHTSLGGEVAAAYIWNVNSGFDIGFEFYYDFVNDLKVEGSEKMINTINLMYGGRVLPGFKITSNTKIYIDLGYNLMDATLDISSANNTHFSSTEMDFTNEGSFQYGAGVETLIYKNLGLRLAYTVQQHGELKFDNDSTSSPEYYEARPTVYNFFFGLSYHFPF